jgi:GH25 family lysozyme M1 (1,4-beta-N-acetylmuramidase)
MGLKYSSFAIRGIDVSQFNGTIDWTKVSAHFSGIRVGYGRTIDTKFKENWLKSKGKVNRIPYWFMDYYSNHTSGATVNGMADAAWGKEQAETCWASLKSDPDGSVFLDIENGHPSYSPAISTVSARAQAIAKGFLERMDELNGKRNGIYCSLGLLNWFSSWFRDRPLWVAWYNESQTPQTVLSSVAKNGWLGKCLIWQYTSDGDMDDDGVGDGVAMGMAYKALDLNAWIGTSAQYTELFGKEVQQVALYKIKILIYNLTVRTGPGVLYPRLRRADFPGEYHIFEEKNGFGRISEIKSEWLSLSPDYVQKISTTTPPPAALTDAEKLARLWAAHPELH